MEKIYDLKGVDGRHLEVYEEKVVLSVKAGFGSFLNGQARNGEKTIYFVDCNGIQFKKAHGLIMGFLQFETASSGMNNNRNKYNNENTFTWDKTKQTNETMEEVVEYCKKRIDAIKMNRNSGNTIIQAASSAEELKKFKELLDMGVITQEEFDTKKKELLGL